MSGIIKVLLVDDDPTIIRGHRRILRNALPESIVFITASNGQEAIDIIKNEMPRLVLTDLMMPGKTGFDVLRECKDEIKKGMIVIVVSGGVSPGFHMRPDDALSLGAEKVFEKPIVDFLEFIRIVKEYLH